MSALKVTLIFLFVVLGPSTVTCNPVLVAGVVVLGLGLLDSLLFGGSSSEKTYTVTCHGTCQVKLDGSITVLKYSSLACLLLYVFLK